MRSKTSLAVSNCADGGTLFLDEIGEVPLAMQAKLLRVLQEQELERIGDTRTRKVSVRVIAATNRDLTKELDEGRFRQDLFYRLRVFPIEVPPLRERLEDIAPLAAHFIKQSARRMNRPEPRITQAALTNSPPTIGLATYGNFRTSSSAASSCGKKVHLFLMFPPRGQPQNSGELCSSRRNSKRCSRARS